MSEQKVSNERKKELEQIDQFQAGLLKAIDYAKKYQKQLLLSVGVLFLVAVVFSSVIYNFKKAENSASTLLTKVLDRYNKASDPQKGYNEIQDDFYTIFADFSNTTAGRQALIQFAKISYDALKFDQSYKYYKQAFEVFKDDDLIKNFLLLSLGNICLDKKDFDEAKKYFIQIEKGESDILKDIPRTMTGHITHVSTNYKLKFNHLLI